MQEEKVDQGDKIMQPEGIDNFQADLPYSGFPSELGNHRAVIQVDCYQPVVRVNLPWRCPRGVRGVTVVDAATGQVVNNVIVQEDVKTLKKICDTVI